MNGFFVNDSKQEVNATINGSLANVHVFHDSAIIVTNGTAFVVGGHKSLVVDIDGAPTSHTLEFKYTGANGIPKTLKGMRVSDWTTATSTTTTAESWIFDITGLTTVIMDLSAIVAGVGSLTVKGTAVA